MAKEKKVTPDEISHSINRITKEIEFSEDRNQEIIGIKTYGRINLMDIGLNSPEVFSALKSAVKKFPENTWNLDLTGNNLSSTQIRELLLILPKNIASLNLSGNGINTLESIETLNFLPKQIEKLNIANEEIITDEAAKALVQVLNNKPGLKILHVKNYKTTPEQMSELSKKFAKLNFKYIKNLDVVVNPNKKPIEDTDTRMSKKLAEGSAPSQKQANDNINLDNVSLPILSTLAAAGFLFSFIMLLLRSLSSTIGMVSTGKITPLNVPQPAQKSQKALTVDKPQKTAPVFAAKLNAERQKPVSNQNIIGRTQ